MGDLPDFITGVDTGVMQAASLVNGADAAKASYPAVGDVYLATDTQKLYICVAAGAWTGFDASILVQGILTLYADLAGAGFEIKNIKDPTAAQSAATRAYVLGQLGSYLTLAHETETTGIHGVGASTIDSVALRDDAIAAEATARAAADALRLLLAGGTMSGAIAMGANKITDLGAPTAAADAARKTEVDAKLGNIVEDTTPQLGGQLDAQSKKIVSLGAPAAATDAARKTDVDTVDAKLDDVSHSSPSRALDTIYQNTSGKIMLVSVTVMTGDAEEARAEIKSVTPPTIDVARIYHEGASGDDIRSSLFFVVPVNWYYRTRSVSGTPTLLGWEEWLLF